MLRPARQPRQRPAEAKLLVVEADGSTRHEERSDLVAQLRKADVLIANDAATVPASLTGVHAPTGETVEVRLAGRASLAPTDVGAFTAVVFGGGDYRTRTEDRPLPPPMRAGDELVLGPLRARVARHLEHPRLVELHFSVEADVFWEGIVRHGRPIQYAHMPEPLALWDVWTRIATVCAAFEPPSAGFLLDWRLLSLLPAHGIAFASLTLAAGISSSGDPEIDARLPLDEPYHIPAPTAAAIRRAREVGGRVVALGTTVARALEHASIGEGLVRSGPGLANQRLGPATTLYVVDAIITGIHRAGESHFEMLRAFAPDDVLDDATEALVEGGYRTHEFGDSMMVVATTRRRAPPVAQRAAPPRTRKPEAPHPRAGT